MTRPSLSSVFKRHRALMPRLRFSFLSVSAMLLAAALATLVVLRPHGDGFGGHLGFPFAWYSWPDTMIDGRVPVQYSWGGLAADIVVWLAVILGFGLFAERVRRRLLEPRKPRDAA
jgi:hypothetical protein